MNVLFIGGTGIISTAVTQEAIDRGIDLTLLNRGTHNIDVPEGVSLLKGDIYNEEEIKALLEGQYYDAVVQWIAFTPEHVKRDVRLFRGHTKQYVFISSASAYQKPIPFLPVTEKTPLDNPYWPYSKNKQLCEEYLLSITSKDFNVTIIRPSHTYNEKMLISQLNSHQHPYTLLNRIKQNKPIIIPDKGMQLWTLTFNQDFAGGFVDVLGNKKTYGKFFHLTSDKVYTWERINEMICEAVDIIPNIVYVPWDVIFEYFPEFKPEILGDKMKSVVFDNKKIKKVAPHYCSETEYSDVLPQIIAYFDDPKRQTVDPDFEARYDACIAAYQAQNSEK